MAAPESDNTNIGDQGCIEKADNITDDREKGGLGAGAIGGKKDTAQRDSNTSIEENKGGDKGTQVIPEASANADTTKETDAGEPSNSNNEGENNTTNNNTNTTIINNGTYPSTTSDTSPRRKKYRKRTKSKRSFANLHSLTLPHVYSPVSPRSPAAAASPTASPSPRGPPRRTISSPVLSPMLSPKTPNGNQWNKNFNSSNINNNNNNNNNNTKRNGANENPGANNIDRDNNGTGTSNNENNNNNSNNNNNNNNNNSNNNNNNNNNNTATTPPPDEGPRPEGRVRSNAFYGRPTYSEPPRPKSLNGVVPTYSEIVSGLATTKPPSPSPSSSSPSSSSSSSTKTTTPSSSSSSTEYISLPLPQLSSSGICRPSKFNWTKKSAEYSCIKNCSRRFLIGFAETIGRRPTMEDCMVIEGTFRGNNNEDYFAVFDGHGGADAAAFAAEHLHVILAEKLKTQNPVKSLREAFVETNQLISDQKIVGGTTACVALFIGKKGYVANVGDTRAVLCRNGITHRVSLDHKPELPQETSRIKKLGGTVTTTTNAAGHSTSRVNGMLAVSRALGDTMLHPYVSAEPEIHGPLNISTTDKSQFMVVACDGVWDVISDEEAVSIVAPIADIDLASRRLRDEAYNRGSTDNISVMVIRFPPFHS